MMETEISILKLYVFVDFNRGARTSQISNQLHRLDATDMMGLLLGAADTAKPSSERKGMLKV